MKNELLIDPATHEEYINVPASIAAKYLGIGLPLLYTLLQAGRLPIGAAAQSAKGIWGYAIPCERLKAWANAADLGRSEV